VGGSVNEKVDRRSIAIEVDRNKMQMP